MALSRLEHEFESRRERQLNQCVTVSALGYRSGFVSSSLTSRSPRKRCNSAQLTVFAAAAVVAHKGRDTLILRLLTANAQPHPRYRFSAR